MKKILFIAAVALAAAACSKTFDTNPAAEQNAISFGSWSETLTKARATGQEGDAAFKNGDSFNVYGTKTVNAEKKTVFDGDVVSAAVAASTVTWDYTTKRYWDPVATQYEFYAVLPAGKLTAGDYAAEGKFKGTFAFGDPTVAANVLDNDIMIADQTVVLPAAYKNAVEMKFNHAASCVDVYVKKDVALDGATVKVTAMSVLGIANEGKFEVENYSAKKPSIKWTDQAGSEDYVVTVPAAGITAGGSTTYDPSSHEATNTESGAGKVFDGYVFMPQNLVAATQKVKISYTIQVGTEEPNVYNDIDIDFADFMKTDSTDNHGDAITKWEPNTHYIYYITIGANAITFTASVNAWAATSINGYHYIIK